MWRLLKVKMWSKAVGCIVIILSIACGINLQSKTNRSENLFFLVENSHDLLQRYIAFCGNFLLCNVSVDQLLDERNYDSSTCPACSCDYDCFIRGDCCPDIKLQYPEYSLRTSIVAGSPENAPALISLIDACPLSSEQMVKQNCEREYTTSEILKAPPVKSLKYNIVFRNKYCALCNSVSSYQRLNFILKCKGKKDPNFFSSYVELGDFIDSFCKMYYDDQITRIRGNPLHVVNKCNLTGTWIVDDPIVKTACESYYFLQYHAYKNVFCYMCNPPNILKMEKIDMCNTTGLWDVYDKTIENNCLLMNETDLTYPFKNLFCRMCNFNNSLNSKFHDFFDVTANIIHSYNYILPSDERFVYEIKIKKLHILPHVHEKYQNKTGRKHRWNSLSNLQSTDVDISKLIKYDYASSGIHKYCKKTIIPKRFIIIKQSCSCEPECFFTDDNHCCLEAELNNPIACISSRLIKNTIQNITTFKIDAGRFSGFRHSQNYLTIEKCINQGVNKELKAMCESQPSTFVDLFSSIPLYDPVRKLSYRNYFCLLCSLPADDANNLSFLPWTIRIKCKSSCLEEFSIHLTNSIEKLLDNYVVEILPPNNEYVHRAKGNIYCMHYKENYNQCLQDSFTDHDIKWACENANNISFPGKNRYCNLCSQNPGKIYDETCQNKTHPMYNKAMDKACKIYPFTGNNLPFKNIFCKECAQGQSAPSYPPTHMPGPLDMQGPPGGNFRKLFVNNEHSFQETQMQIGHIDEDQERGVLYDSVHKTYRNMTCFPGKNMFNASCVPLLEKTSKLYYIFSVLIDGTTNMNASYVTNAHKMKSFIQNTLNDTVKKASDSPVNILFLNYIQALDCNDDKLKMGLLKIYIYQSFLVLNEIHRSRLEEDLILLTSKNISDLFFKSNDTFQNSSMTISVSLQAYLLPSMQNKHLHTGYCYSYLTDSSIPGEIQGIRPILIATLLCCRQIEFDKSEYDIRHEGLDIQLKHINSPPISILNYFITQKGKARICAEFYKNLILAHNKSIINGNIPFINKLLHIISFIFALISLVSLIITFVIYILLPSLRTIPGINIMNLVFSMVFALGLFLFGYGANVSFYICAAIGILCHYFWLCTFTAMNICSFHMHYMFVIKSSQILPSNKKKQIKIYMLYSYGVPLIIVTCNITACYITATSSSFLCYGVNTCFITSQKSAIFSFLLPVVLLCFFNIYFFVRTALSIKQAPKIESNKDKKDNFVIFLKLFSLTGITWLLLILDSLQNVSIFSFIIHALVCFQGLFIFLSFVCNKRVFSQLKKRLHIAITTSGFTESKDTRISSISTKPSTSRLDSSSV